MGKKSKKTDVIERIFVQRWDPSSNNLSATMVTNVDIADAIRWANEHRGTALSERNPANFIKDVIRGKGASSMWPTLLHKHRWGAVQVTGQGNVFEFVPYADGQDEAFPTRFGYHPAVERHQLQSISIPLATKALGRDDETYLIQVAVKLAVVETHFALFSAINVIELNHLQIGIKLRLCEVDSLFSAIYCDSNGNHLSMIITAEAKKKNQRIIEEQIMQQVLAAFNETGADIVVPIAMTSTDDGIYLAEFQSVWRDERSVFKSLTLASERLYELVPRVKGI